MILVITPLTIRVKHFGNTPGKSLKSQLKTFLKSLKEKFNISWLMRLSSLLILFLKIKTTKQEITNKQG
ncbi:hypothetical protein A0H76_2482 [Hepatospora eriocheir]|uniref:Uncharacterized protein n=1 Tax=Hepatospora eriocheir TaxID=1081669 RepID=A0A1X0QJS0_9MICR|nr:hypothetical protein A0H76_2482 [Hepatospora eriocheir]